MDWLRFTTARRRPRRLARLAACLGLALVGNPAAAQQGGDDAELERLVRQFAAMPGLSARFVEEKHLSLLRAPLTSEGTLDFAPPDRIARRVVKPAPSFWIVRGDQLVLSDADQVRTLDLASQPFLRPFIEALRLVLTGDLPRLRERFEIEFQHGRDGDPPGWSLRLVPREGPLQRAVAAIEIEGVEGSLRSLRVREVGGDETLDRFQNVDTARRFSEGELARIFDVPKP